MENGKAILIEEKGLPLTVDINVKVVMYWYLNPNCLYISVQSVNFFLLIFLSVFQKKNRKSKKAKKANVADATDEIVDKLKKLAELKDAGIITEDEFKQMKQRILDKF